MELKGKDLFLFLERKGVATTEGWENVDGKDLASFTTTEFQSYELTPLEIKGIRDFLSTVSGWIDPDITAAAAKPGKFVFDHSHPVFS
jgi:hypothetical protein